MFSLVADVVVVVVVDVDAFPTVSRPVGLTLLVARGDWAFWAVFEVVVGRTFAANLAAKLGVVRFEMAWFVAPFAIVVAANVALTGGKIADVDFAVGQILDVHAAEAEVGCSDGDLV